MAAYQKNANLVSGLTPGVWNKGTEGAVFTCPICGLANDLSKYTVGAEGSVTSALDCAADGCLFSENITLSGWEV